MFTGLVQAVGTVRSLQPLGTPGHAAAGGQPIVQITIDPTPWDHRPALGDSISIDGCCLTVANTPTASRSELVFHAVPETLQKTTLGARATGSRVNLEHAVTASTLMGGHFVQGHVDGTGRVISLRSGDDWRVRVEPPAHLMPYFAPKGSVTLSGVSLTIAALHPGDPHPDRLGQGGWIEVALIPVTLAKTNLADLRVGDLVNIEADVLAKQIVHYLKHYTPRV